MNIININAGIIDWLTNDHIICIFHRYDDSKTGICTKCYMECKHKMDPEKNGNYCTKCSKKYDWFTDDCETFTDLDKFKKLRTNQNYLTHY